MAEPVEINDVAAIGVIKDIPPYMIPPEAWTGALNVLPQKNGMEVTQGWEQIFGTPAIAPHFAISITNASQTFWIYSSLTAAAVWDGAAHTAITRLAGPYTATDSRDWNGTIFAGIPILNNGQDVPQFWAALSAATKLANLTNWPATLRAKKLVSLGNFLIAINITDNAVNFPHLIKWSSGATDPGTLPASWDETDETVDTGEYDLPDVNSGILQDALGLGTKLFLYKDQSIWWMRFIGGRAVFAIDTFIDGIGILAPRCVALTGDGKYHVVATKDDIVKHDGTNTPESILDNRARSALFEDLDPTNYMNSFMFTDPRYNIVVFCYPQNSFQYPNHALVYNYKTGAITEMDGINFRWASAGRVEAIDPATWDASVGTWDSDTAPWSLAELRRIVLCNPTDSKLHKWLSSYQRDGMDYAVQLQRTGLSIEGKKRSGEWIVNHQMRKIVDRVWPKIKGNGPIFIRLGKQEVVDGAVEWTEYKEFNPRTEVFADLMAEGRAIAIEFYTPSASEWRLDGYRLALEPNGEF